MTDLAFHSGVADPVAFACRLLRRAARQGVGVQVTAPAELLLRLDLALWTQDEQDFVPHVRMPGAPAAVARRTHIWLAKAALQGDAPRVLMNLGAPAPADLSVSGSSSENKSSLPPRFNAIKHRASGTVIRTQMTRTFAT